MHAHIFFFTQVCSVLNYVWKFNPFRAIYLKLDIFYYPIPFLYWILAFHLKMSSVHWRIHTANSQHLIWKKNLSMYRKTLFCDPALFWFKYNINKYILSWQGIYRIFSRLIINLQKFYGLSQNKDRPSWLYSVFKTKVWKI